MKTKSWNDIMENWKKNYIQCPHCGDWTDPLYNECMCCKQAIRDGNIQFQKEFYSELTDKDIENLLHLVGNFQCKEADIIHGLLQDLNGIYPILEKYFKKHPVF